ncbi:hypothetical protein A3L04_07320 [Thermococcus chitonophagus]|uniref:DUF996 domain-containing protein n=1 Tax=Thermococcus chitonophagus TaxID=54262 RepID=A0A170SQ08_9EURY|nr:DUF996 domain-containing protein [Thermococcus chitonophagus]ASJ16894.1 hypothetical protein A3L04_07320 [Thermococcus chitonophagus]CUX78374.1 hypothetical protein CHITON_1595 [Thermococcus chitonophagus]
MSMSNAKMYGGIGAIIGLVGPLVPHIGFVLSIVGLVLIFLAVKIISDETGDKDIFSYFLKAFIAIVGGLIVFIIIVVATVGAAFLNPKELMPTNILSFIGVVLVGLIILWIAMIIGMYFRKKSYELIAQYTGVDMFKTAGLLYFIGAILLIIGIGALIAIIAAILEIVAFFSLPEEVQKSEVSSVSS